MNRFSMGIQSSMNCTNFKGLNIRKFLLMSRGFEERGGHQKLSDAKDFANFNQVVVGNENSAIDASPPYVLVFNHITNKLLNELRKTTDASFIATIIMKHLI